MINLLKKVIKETFRLFNLDVKKIQLAEKNKFSWLKQMRIRTVFDIGANIGQFVKQIHNILPEANIYSFEPIKDCFEQLQKTMGSTMNFRVFNCALGDKVNEPVIYKNEFSPASSLFEMTELCKEAFPHTAQSTKEKVSIKRLDDAVREFNLELKENILIKIDVQGYEDKVIAGGRSVISRAKVIIAEVSFWELYKNQKLFNDIYQLLTGLGFKYKGNIEQIMNPIDGRPLQADAIFLKEDNI